jgi:hypothetical protein
MTIVSTSGKAIEGVPFRKFQTSLLGQIIGTDDDIYDTMRRSWTGMIDTRCPALIVRCAATSDVMRAIDFARSNELKVAVRGGGHSLSGDSFCDGGMLIDVSRMKGLCVDPLRRVAHAEAGLTVGEFDRATEPYNLAAVLGECASVGIAGFTLGGGLGRLMGKHGAACDNILSAKLVTANGEFVRASPEENDDLYWAVRGGGGNFGIVTELEYKLHHAGLILGGVLTYPISAVRDVLQFLDDYMTNVPAEFDIVIDIGNKGIMTFAPRVMEPIVSLAVSYCGDLEQGEGVLRPLRSFRQPVTDTVKAMPYPVMQALSDIRPLAEFGSAGGSMALEGGFIRRFDKKAIETIIDFIGEAPTCFWITAEHYLHGAVCRPAQVVDTAFALRCSGYTSRIFSAWNESNQAEPAMAWVKRLSAELDAQGSGALYLNYLTDTRGEAGVRAAYGSNYGRLVALKNKYDPTNFFSSNRNIRPEL